MRFVHPCFDGLVQTAVEYWLRCLEDRAKSLPQYKDILVPGAAKPYKIFMAQGCGLHMEPSVFRGMWVNVSPESNRTMSIGMYCMWNHVEEDQIELPGKGLLSMRNCSRWKVCAARRRTCCSRRSKI